MVRFEENKLVIEIENSDPVEAWIELQQGLCDLIRFVNSDTLCPETFYGGLCDLIRFVNSDTLCPETFYGVIDLVGELVPEHRQAKKMLVE